MRLLIATLLLGTALVTQPAFARAGKKSEDKSVGSCADWQRECAKSKNPKSCFPGRCGAWGENDYLANDEEGGQQAKPLIKKATKSKKKKISVISCKTAFIAAQKSPSTGEVMDAIEICNNAAQKVCAKNSDGTGDGRYVTAACMLNAAYKGNMAANENKATAKCEKAHKEAMESPSTGDVMGAIDACQEETQETCRKLADGTGDGRLIAANCMLNAAHGEYVGVTTKEQKVVDANSCGGKPAPRICKGSCYVNYACVNNKWEISPVRSCALCGDAAKGLESIDIIDGESKAGSAE